VNPSNLLFIMSDQHARRVLGCYGNSGASTPHLDALARSGTRFGDAYCPVPVCVPSRSSLATGRYAHTISSWDNATPYVGTEAESWGHRVSGQGYKVTTIGKLHYRQVGDPTGFEDQRLPMHVLNGVGDLYGALRAQMPVRPDSRRRVIEACAGESEYTRYDRAVAAEAVRWLKEEGCKQQKPWALFVSFVHPHFPLTVPAGYLKAIKPDDIPMPIRWKFDEWPHHPVIDWKRHIEALDRPFEEATIRNALHVYYGMVAFLDEQIGIVLDALGASGQSENTRIIYSSDHGDMLGDHGLWWKSTMYQGAAAIPMVIAGPDVPSGKVVQTSVSLVDCFQTIVEAVGAVPAAADDDLPGRSLWQIARAEDHPRTILAEYHAIFSPTGAFMLRRGRWKYVHYVGYAPQLFDLNSDPDETLDLAASASHSSIVESCERELRAIVDPEDVDRRAKADQLRRITQAGGIEAVKAMGVTIPYTPPPREFGSSLVRNDTASSRSRTPP
jgi:choline-sulfatase